MPTNQIPNHKIRWPGCVAAIITAALLPLAASTAATANTDTKNAGTANSSTASDIQDPAVAMYTAEYSVSPEDAVRRLARIGPLHDLIATIREAEADRLAGWGIDHFPIFAGWVLLTGTSPATAISRAISESNNDLEIRTGAAHTYDHLLQAKRGLRSIGPIGRVDNLGDSMGITNIISFTAVDMAANAVEIGIDPKPPANTPQQIGEIGSIGTVNDTFAAESAAFAVAIAPHINVAFTVVDGRGFSNHTTFYAGQPMSTCTAGFTATRGGVKGILTAGHCSDNQTINGISLPHVVGYNSAAADAQFHAVPSGSGHVLKNGYACRTRSRNICQVHSRRSRLKMMGDIVCHTGKNSGTSCGTVNRIDVSPDYTEAGEVACINTSDEPARKGPVDSWAVDCKDVFVNVTGTRLRQCKGDSGGPWYRSGIAYGIHMGGTNVSCSKENVNAHFSAILEVENFLGVSIITAGDLTVN